MMNYFLSHVLNIERPLKMRFFIFLDNFLLLLYAALFASHCYSLYIRKTINDFFLNSFKKK